MLVLGLIVVAGLCLHLYDFWSKMMLQELIGGDTMYATDGVYWIRNAFADPIHVVIYLIWLVALWFHLTHGFWSALQTLGWNGKTWFCRWKVISIAYATLLFAGFAIVVIYFAFSEMCCHSCC